MRSTLTLAVLGLSLTGCGFGKEDRQELVTELRTLGVAATPLVSSPSVAGQAPNTVDLTLYAALPISQSPTVEPFQDSARPSSGAVQLDESAIAVETTALASDYYSNLQIMHVHARVTLPPASAFKSPAGGQVEYGFKLTAGGRTEKVIGDVLVVPAGASQLSYQNPTLALAAPTAGASVQMKKSLDLTATVGNPNSEDLTLGWFCTDGEVQNRRAASTTWTPSATGEQTLVLVAHGHASRGFAMQVVQVVATAE